MQDVVIVDRVYFISLLEMQADDEYNVVALCKLMRRMLYQGSGKLICPGGSKISLENCTIGVGQG